MVNRSEILRSAWADYRRDQRMGLGVRRDGPFSRKHFAYCLRMAWAVAKEVAAEADQTPKFEVCAGPVATVLSAVNLLDAVKAARVAEIDNELLWQEMGERIDWTERSNLQTERHQLLTA